jgi:nucleoside-diphosphate-sugar epimerase
MKRVAVTGASGFIGRNTLPILLDKGYEVHALYYPETVALTDHGDVQWHKCNLLEEGDARRVLEDVRPEALLHFAWYTEHGRYWDSQENIKWVRASLSLMSDFIECGGTRSVFAGTCAEYEWQGGTGYLSEESTPRRPRTLYGICKNSLQEILSGISEKTAHSSAWGRIFFPYGPYESRERLVPSVIISLLKGGKAACSHGEQIRDYIHCQDVASAFVALMESDVRGPVNIGSGRAVALKSIIFMIADMIGKRDMVRLGEIPTPEDEPPVLIADVQKLREVVGWKPGLTLEEGLRSTIDWWKDNS